MGAVQPLAGKRLSASGEEGTFLLSCKSLAASCYAGKRFPTRRRLDAKSPTISSCSCLSRRPLMRVIA